MWDVVGARQIASMQDEKIPPPIAMALSPDGHIAWTCASDGAVTAWDTVSGSHIRSLVTQTGQATCIAANGSCVVSGGIDKTIRLWDLSRPAAYREFERKLQSVHKSLNTNPNDATALAVLGEWYAFRQFDHWAVDLLERARNGGAQVSPLMLAHCYWNLSESDPASKDLFGEKSLCRVGDQRGYALPRTQSAGNRERAKYVRAGAGTT